MGYLRYQLVQDFFHQQYDPSILWGKGWRFQTQVGGSDPGVFGQEILSNPTCQWKITIFNREIHLQKGPCPNCHVSLLEGKDDLLNL